MTIGKLAEQCGIGVETVRYYERRGLIAEPQRTKSGYRRYADDAVDRIRFIVSAKELGFTLGEISGLLSISTEGEGVEGTTDCDSVRALAEEKRNDIERRIRMLKSIRRTLDELIGACERNEATGSCPIIRSLVSSDGKGSPTDT